MWWGLSRIFDSSMALPSNPVFSTDKTDHQDRTGSLFNVTIPIYSSMFRYYYVLLHRHKSAFMIYGQYISVCFKPWLECDFLTTKYNWKDSSIQFYRWRKRDCWVKPLNCRKSLTNLTTSSCIDYTCVERKSKAQLLLVINTNCKCW
jgi:hypothetical protein